MAEVKKKKTSTTLKDDLNISSEEEAKALFTSIITILSKPYLHSFINRLKNLAKKPPQLILFEGADFEVRYAIAKYWACLLNCENDDAPCGTCTSCLKIIAEEDDDFQLYNGLEESIKIEVVRDKIVPFIALPPSYLKKRVFTFYEANNLTDIAANGLLKSFEEPNRTTFFILAIAQKEMLLPTLVSRSLLFSLPNEVNRELNDNEKEILQAITQFLISGKGLFDEFTSQKGFNRQSAKLFIHILSLSLNAYYSSDNNTIYNELSRFYKEHLKDEKCITITNFINDSLEMIEDSNAPNCSLIIDTLFVQIHMLLHE